MCFFCESWKGSYVKGRHPGAFWVCTLNEFQILSFPFCYRQFFINITQPVSFSFIWFINPTEKEDSSQKRTKRERRLITRLQQWIDKGIKKENKKKLSEAINLFRSFVVHANLPLSITCFIIYAIPCNFCNTKGSCDAVYGWVYQLCFSS